MPRSIVNITGRSGSGYGISRYLPIDAHSFWMVVAEQNDYVTDSELNAMQEITRAKESDLLYAIANSGFFGQAAGQPAFVFGGSYTANQFGSPDQRANVSGTIVRVADPTKSAGTSTVVLAAAPGSGTRNDAVFLEVWLQEIAPGGTAGSVDTLVYEYGNVNSSQYINDILDPNITVETTRRVQLRWRFTYGTGVNITTSPYGLGDPACFPQAAQASPVTTVHYQQPSWDSNLWTVGDGLKTPIITPTGLAVTSGGTAGGTGTTYNYVVTAYYQGPNGEYSETSASAVGSLINGALSSTGYKNTLNWTAASFPYVVGSTIGYKIYGRTTSPYYYIPITTLSAAATNAANPQPTNTWTDDGSIALGTIAAPTANTTGGGTLLNTVDGYSYAIPVAIVLRTAGDTLITTSMVTDKRIGAATWPQLTSGSLSLSGTVTAKDFVSTVATGTQPYAASSTTMNTNLNADLLDGYEAGTPGGFQINSVAITSSTGYVGGANQALALTDANGVVRYGTLPGGTAANGVVIANASGQAGSAALATTATNVFDNASVPRAGSAPGGTQANSVAITSSGGQVGSAALATTATNVVDSTGVARPGGYPGGGTANSVAITDSNGFVLFSAYSNALFTYSGPTITATYSIGAPGGTGSSNGSKATITDSNGNVGAANNLASGTTLYPPTTPGGVPAAASVAITTTSGQVGSALYATNAGELNGYVQEISNSINGLPLITAINTFDNGINTNVNGYAMSIYSGHGAGNALITYTPGTAPGSLAIVNADGLIHNNISGYASTLLDNAGAVRTLSAPGTNVANFVASYDSSGRVVDSENLHGLAYTAFDTAGAATAVQNSLNTHEASNLSLTTHGYNVSGPGNYGSTYSNMLAQLSSAGQVGDSLRLNGIQASGYGAVTANSVAVTGAYGDVGSALNIGNGTGTHYLPTSPGGITVNAVAITDATYGGVGRANRLQDSLGNYWQGAASGTNAASTYALYDSSGRVYDSERLVGLVPTSPAGTQATSIMQTDSTGTGGAVYYGRNGTTNYAFDSPGGVTPNRIPVLDGTYGGVGRANRLQDAGGSYWQGAVPGQSATNAYATYDSSGRVYDSERLGGATVKYGSVNPVSIGNQSYTTFAISFGYTYSGPPAVIASIYAGSGGAIVEQYGMQCIVYGVTTTGCTVEVGQTTGSTQNLGCTWFAFGT